MESIQVYFSPVLLDKPIYACSEFVSDSEHVYLSKHMWFINVKNMHVSNRKKVVFNKDGISMSQMIEDHAQENTVSILVPLNKEEDKPTEDVIQECMEEVAKIKIARKYKKKNINPN